MKQNVLDVPPHNCLQTAKGVLHTKPPYPSWAIGIGHGVLELPVFVNVYNALQVFLFYTISDGDGVLSSGLSACENDADPSHMDHE